MTPDVRPLVAGNWKMNGLSGSLAEIDAMRQAADAGESGDAELLVCPPATLLAQAAWRIKGGELGLGAQDCATEPSGPFTGDISAAMLRDAGASYVIVGHSERRMHHNETDELVRAKAEAALKAGLIPIVCVGETQAQREAGEQAAVVIRQLRGFAAFRGDQRDGRRRLRTDLGDRHRPHRDAQGRGRHTQWNSRAARRHARSVLRQDSPSLRRVSQLHQLSRAFDPRQCRRRAGRGR